MSKDDGFIHLRGAREHNLKDLSLKIPRDALVVFTGVSGSGKSSLAFGTLYAEAQRRYLESVSPYARRLFHQVGAPDVDEITGLPPAVALQQQRGTPTTRSSVGSVTTLSNLLRMLYSRAGDYPKGQGILYAEGFSANTVEGACPTCHGLGRVYDVPEHLMVPDPNKTIRDRAIAAWPTAWGGQNQRDILVSMGIDVDIPWKDLPKKTRDWILYTEERPEHPVYPGYTPAETRRAIKRNETPNYMGTFIGAKKYVLDTFATTHSDLMKRRVQQFMSAADCPSCKGKRLKPEALSITFAGLDIADLSALPLKKLATVFEPYATKKKHVKDESAHPEKAIVTQRIAEDLSNRITDLMSLGLGYLTLDRSTPTLSPGELQRLRLATQIRSNLFGVVYVLDEPSAGLHPADTEALLAALDKLKAAGNSLFVVEHDLDVIRRADWIVDVGPNAGTGGGEILFSGSPADLAKTKNSHTRRYLFPEKLPTLSSPRAPRGWLKLAGITRNNLQDLSIEFPLGVLTCVTGVSGSGKSSLVSQALVDLVAEHLGQRLEPDEDNTNTNVLEREETIATHGRIVSGMEHLKRMVRVDQKPIGRTPRSNLATYTGLFDRVRHLFAATPEAKRKRYDAGQFSFNVAKGRCPNCSGEGFVFVELLFLPSVYAPCPVCGGKRYNEKTLSIHYNGKTIADILDMTVDEAAEFFKDDASLHHSLDVLRQVGLTYLRLGQAATTLSGGEAQRIKLATELQKLSRGGTLYVLDEPTTGLHPHDVDKLLVQLNLLIEAGHTVVLVEHEMQVLSRADWVIDIGPGPGDEGGRLTFAGPPAELLHVKQSRTAPFLRNYLEGR